jgi:hypothetical protein
MADYCWKLYQLAKPVMQDTKNKKPVNESQFQQFMEFCVTAMNEAGYDLTRHDRQLLELPLTQAAVKFQEESIRTTYFREPEYIFHTYGYVVDCILAEQKRAAILTVLKAQFLKEQAKTLLRALNVIREQNKYVKITHPGIIRIDRGKEFSWYTFIFGNMAADSRFDIEFRSYSMAAISLIYIEDMFRKWMEPRMHLLTSN